MDYFISLIAEQTRDLIGEEYPVIRFYAADDQNLLFSPQQFWQRGMDTQPGHQITVLMGRK